MHRIGWERGEKAMYVGYNFSLGEPIGGGSNSKQVVGMLDFRCRNTTASQHILAWLSTHSFERDTLHRAFHVPADLLGNVTPRTKFNT